MRSAGFVAAVVSDVTVHHRRGSPGPIPPQDAAGGTVHPDDTTDLEAPFTLVFPG